jgi:hypothetical protein
MTTPIGWRCSNSRPLTAWNGWRRSWENVAALAALVDLLDSRGAFGLTLGEALQARSITVREVVETVRGAVPDPLAQ